VVPVRQYVTTGASACGEARMTTAGECATRSSTVFAFALDGEARASCQFSAPSEAAAMREGANSTSAASGSERGNSVLRD
jgi:hypothetical protein